MQNIQDFEFDEEKQCFVKINPQKKQLLIYDIKNLTKLVKEEYKGFKTLSISLEGIARVSENAFKNCQFERIYIVDIDKRIKELTFADCPKLKKLVFGKSLSPKNKERKTRYRSASLINLKKITLDNCRSIEKIDTIACPKAEIVCQGATSTINNLKQVNQLTKDIPECISLIRDFINEGTDSIVSKILSGNLDNFSEAIKLFDELLSILKRKNFASLMTELNKSPSNKLFEYPPAEERIRIFRVSLDAKNYPFTGRSSPFIVINSLTKLKKDLSEIKVSGSKKKAVLNEVLRILPDITSKEEYALNGGRAKKIVDLYKHLEDLEDFNWSIVKSIELAKRGDYQKLQDCTNDEEIDDFIENRQKDFTENTKLLCAEFVNHFKNKANEFDNFVKSNNITAVAERQTITEKPEEVLNTMKQQWSTLKVSLQEDSGYGQPQKYDTEKLSNEATKKGQELIKLGLLDENDIKYNVNANSEKFVKAFIRYLERSFPDLKDDISIFYFASDQSKERDNRYAKIISELKSKSKKDGKIYFIINQLYVRLYGQKTFGHGNLTVIRDGKSSLIDSSPYARAPIDRRTTDNSNKGTLQSRFDTGNCVSIALGAVESFLKQITKLKNDTSKSSEEHLGKKFGNYIDSFLDAKVPIDYLYDYDEENGKLLLPPKYLKYLQSTTRIDRFLEMAKNKDPNDKNYQEIQQVAEEFKKVKKNYFKLDVMISEPYKKQLQTQKGIDEFLKMAENKSKNDEDYDYVKWIAMMLNNVPLVNARAEMKRQTEILKISQLVDSLKNNGINVQEDIHQVKTF